MNQLLISLMILIVTQGVLLADDPKKMNTLSSSDIIRVVLKLEDRIVLENSSDDSIRIRVETETRGEIHGFSNHERIPAYQVSLEHVGEVLAITPSPRPRSWSIGISTLHETHIHYLQIPQNKKVEIISDESSLDVEGEFHSLLIQNRSGAIDLTVADKSLRYLKCRTKSGSIKWNNDAVESSYTMEDSGESVVEIFTVNGTINVASEIKE